MRKTTQKVLCIAESLGTRLMNRIQPKSEKVSYKPRAHAHGGLGLQNGEGVYSR